MVLAGKEILVAIAWSAGFTLLIILTGSNPGSAVRMGVAFLLVWLVSNGTRNARIGRYGLG